MQEPLCNMQYAGPHVHHVSCQASGRRDVLLLLSRLRC